MKPCGHHALSNIQLKQSPILYLKPKKKWMKKRDKNMCLSTWQTLKIFKTKQRKSKRITKKHIYLVECFGWIQKVCEKRERKPTKSLEGHTNLNFLQTLSSLMFALSRQKGDSALFPFLSLSLSLSGKIFGDTILQAIWISSLANEALKSSSNMRNIDMLFVFGKPKHAVFFYYWMLLLAYYSLFNKWVSKIFMYGLYNLHLVGMFGSWVGLCIV